MRKARQRSRRVGHGIEFGGFMTVVDQDHEAACQPSCGLAHPVDRRETDLGAPAWFEIHPERGQVFGERGRRQRALAQPELAGRRLSM